MRFFRQKIKKYHYLLTNIAKMPLQLLAIKDIVCGSIKNKDLI